MSISQLQLWCCPECRVVYGFPALPTDDYIPMCTSHTESWPGGTYSRSVEMFKIGEPMHAHAKEDSIEKEKLK
jgi:hypothetical protein